MTNVESIEARLARIEEHVRNIDDRLSQKVVCCRHVTDDGKCEFYPMVQEHDRRINQWTGALALMGLMAAAIGSLIGYVRSRLKP